MAIADAGTGNGDFNGATQDPGVAANIAGGDGIVDIDTVSPGPTDPTSFTAPKRGRGRPPKNAGDSAGGESSHEGRQKSSAKGSTLGLNADLFATQLVGIHQMLAMVTKQDVFIITEPEAKKLATALKGVMALHKLNISPSQIAWFQLVGVCAAIYGPRVAVLVTVNKMKKQAAQEEAAPNAMSMM